MNPGGDFRIVLVTAPDHNTARILAQKALEARTVACANLIPGVESHYWWKGRIESSEEWLILFKTSVEHLSELERIVIANHPYDTAEIISVPLSEGTERYLSWLRESTRGRES